MKKLSKVQWITLGLTVLSFIVSRLETFGLTAKAVAQVVEIVGILKFVYDTYISFSAQNMVDFADQAHDATNYSARNVEVLSTTDKLEAFIEDHK